MERPLPVILYEKLVTTTPVEVEVVLAAARFSGAVGVGGHTQHTQCGQVQRLPKELQPEMFYRLGYDARGERTTTTVVKLLLPEERP